MRQALTIAAFVLLTAGCATEKAHESLEDSRVQDCKLRYGPYNPQLEHCLEHARKPYGESGKQGTGSESGPDSKTE